MTSASRPPLDRRLYGRRRSHKLRAGRAELMESLAADYGIPELLERRLHQRAGSDAVGGAASQADEAAREKDETAPSTTIDLAGLFPDATDVWLEIGFGGGEHLAALAAAHPDIGFIGCEHYIDGVAKLASTLARDGLQNVRIYDHDARDLMDALPDGALGRVYLLYPDPWPKKRHHRRRFITQETLDVVDRVLSVGGELRIASDIPDYIRHCLQELFSRRRSGKRSLSWTAERAADWREPWFGWPGTRYERKALAEERQPLYVTFRKS